MNSMNAQLQPDEIEDRHIPIACLLPERERGARGDELAEIFGNALEERELPDGYEFRFPADDALALRLLEFINFERQCCPFFKFELIFEPENGPTWLNIRGPSGVKDLVREGFAPLLANTSPNSR